MPPVLLTFVCSLKTLLVGKYILSRHNTVTEVLLKFFLALVHKKKCAIGEEKLDKMEKLSDKPSCCYDAYSQYASQERF